MYYELKPATSRISQAGWKTNTTYYWRVRGINAAGGAGAWSAVRNFRTAGAATKLAGRVR